MENQPIVKQQTILYTPTVINAPLPSLGKIYPENSLLYNKEYLEIQEMSGLEEDLLTSPALLKSGKSIDAVLKNCILDKNIDVEDLILGDRNSLVISLILASYGNTYKVDVTCNSCDFKNKEYKFDINKLPIKNLKTESLEKGKNEFIFTLPKSKIITKFKLLTHKEDLEIKEYVQKIKNISKDSKEKYATTRLKFEILALNNVVDKNEISSIIDSRQLPIKDTIALRDYIDSISPDVITEQEFKCSDCGEVETIKIPISFEFFWRRSR